MGWRRTGRRADALTAFREAVRLRPADGPARAMAERCELFQKNPLPEPWDAVFEQLTK
jgi:hypothetical protein